MSLLTLGSVDFEGFEIPARVSFGGAQKLSVHTLIGGTRVIDTMGRDDAALEWSGTLSGPTASARARVLDAMRAAGDVQTLTWDVFSYTVVIQRLKLDFCSPWWIPYALECEVQRDLAQGVKPYAVTAAAAVTNDLAVAASLLQTGLTGGLTGVSKALAAATVTSTKQTAATLLDANSTISQIIETSGAQLGSGDLGVLTISAGSIAQLCCARSYISRSISNTIGLVN